MKRKTIVLLTVILGTPLVFLGLALAIKSFKQGMDLGLLLNYGILVLTTAYVGLTFILAKSAADAIQTQVQLHSEINRPSIHCDFPITHTLTYLRVKNYGNSVAKDVRVKADGFPEFEHMAIAKHSVPILTPGSEVIYFVCGPQEAASLARTFTLEIAFADERQKTYTVVQHFDLAFLGIPGSDARGVDLGREENDPVVREMKKIAKALEKRCQ